MKTLKRDGFTIAYQQTGNPAQPPIFVIGSAIYYPRLFQDDVYQDFHFIFLDHRGFLEPTQKNIYALDVIVDDIEAIRQALKIDKIYVLGHSGHGFMAMAYAKQYPAHVSGIILSNLAPTNTQERQNGSIEYFETIASPERKAAFYSDIAQLQDDIKKDPTKRFSHMNIRMRAHSFYNFNVDGSYLWDDVYNNLEALDSLWGDAFATFDTKAFIKNWTKPLLLLLSDKDYLVAPTNLWDPLLKGTPYKMIKFDQSGHNPMLEEPILYAQHLKNFIR